MKKGIAIVHNLMARINLKMVVALVFLIGLATPIEPILSIHRAGRMSKQMIKSTMSNESIGDPMFEGDLSRLSHLHSQQEKVQQVGNKTHEVVEHYTRADALFCALLSASLVGMSGIFPLLLFSNVKNGPSLHEGENSKTLNRLLSFAIGGLLGDVFLHLLPESWDHLSFVHADGTHDHWPALYNGLWVLLGLISFCLLEKIVPDTQLPDGGDANDAADKKGREINANHNNNNHFQKNGISVKNCANGHCKARPVEVAQESGSVIKTSGYLNLLANCIDNFTHGLAVGGSYLVSRRVGVLTTLAILLHEIPHEVGDFAILLKAGFSRWHAAKLQILTATGGLLGATTAFAAESAKSAGDQVAWILPFTSGGFIYVSLCTVVPDILQEKCPRESCVQILIIILAIGVMHAVSYIG